MEKKLLAVVLASLFTVSAHAGLAERPEVVTFVDEMAAAHGFDRAELSRLFAQVEFRDDIIEAITRPAEAKPWHQYRPIFVTESRIREGAEFWRENADLLASVSTEYGVPPAVLAAIVGVETRYGRYQGRHRVMDALSTLAFGYPKRASFFRGQLEHFLLMAREEGFEPLSRLGSYAGAMGQPQFIPSSFRAYAVDFDHSGQRDLWDSTADVLGSVGNYFHRHHWRPGQPVAVPADVDGTRYRALLDKGYKPSVPVAQLADYGVRTEQELDPSLDAALIELEGKEGPEYWVVLHNFYVITRYNHSPLYAMAAYQLSEGIREVVAKAK